MYVTEEDKKNELKIVKAIAGHITPLQGFTFRQNRADNAALFDFSGIHPGTLQEACLDVKTLSVDPDKYNSNIVSTEKIDHFKTHLDALHFIVYYYEICGMVRIYNLNGISLTRKTIEIFHKRAKRLKTCEIYSLDPSEMHHEFPIKSI